MHLLSLLKNAASFLPKSMLEVQLGNVLSLPVDGN
jgi:hypothetical protein